MPPPANVKKTSLARHFCVCTHEGDAEMLIVGIFGAVVFYIIPIFGFSFICTQRNQRLLLYISFACVCVRMIASVSVLLRLSHYTQILYAYRQCICTHVVLPMCGTHTYVCCDGIQKMLILSILTWLDVGVKWLTYIYNEQYIYINILVLLMRNLCRVIRHTHAQPTRIQS